MKYHLDVSSIAGTEPIEIKHQRLFDHWSQFSTTSKWRLSEIPHVPTQFRGGTLARRTLAFANPHITGTIYYALRTPECVKDTDFLNIQFDPEQADYPCLLREIIPMFIEAFSPWRIVIGDDRFQEAHINPEGPTYVGGPRACGGYLEPVFFMSADEIKSISGYDLPTFIDKISPAVEKATAIQNGALVIGSSDILSFEDALDLTKQMEASLKRPTFFQKFRKMIGK